MQIINYRLTLLASNNCVSENVHYLLHGHNSNEVHQYFQPERMHQVKSEGEKIILSYLEAGRFKRRRVWKEEEEKRKEASQETSKYDLMALGFVHNSESYFYVSLIRKYKDHIRIFLTKNKK